MSTDALDLIGIRTPDPRERDLADVPLEKLDRLLGIYNRRLQLAPNDQMAQMKQQLVFSEITLRLAVHNVREDLVKLASVIDAEEAKKAS